MTCFSKFQITSAVSNQILSIYFITIARLIITLTGLIRQISGSYFRKVIINNQYFEHPVVGAKTVPKVQDPKKEFITYYEFAMEYYFYLMTESDQIRLWSTIQQMSIIGDFAERTYKLTNVRTARVEDYVNTLISTPKDVFIWRLLYIISTTGPDSDLMKSEQAINDMGITEQIIEILACCNGYHNIELSDFLNKEDCLKISCKKSSF